MTMLRKALLALALVAVPVSAYAADRLCSCGEDCKCKDCDCKDCKH